MCRSDGSFWIDSLTFAEELIESYDRRVKPRLADAAFERKMNERYADPRRVYRAHYKDMKSQLDQAPTAPSQQQPSSTVLMPNSPSGVPIRY